MLRVSPSRADDAARPVEMTDDLRHPLFPEVADKAGLANAGVSQELSEADKTRERTDRLPVHPPRDGNASERRGSDPKAANGGYEQ